MTRIVNVSEAKAQLSRLLESVQSGQPVIIGRAGRPIAVLSAYEPDVEPRTLGGWEGQVWIGTDFDDPLPAELSGHFEDRLDA